MTKPGLIISAGKMIAAAGRRALTGRSLTLKPEELLNDRTLEKQGAATPSGTVRKKSQEQGIPAAQAEAGNPKNLDYENLNLGQEQAGNE